MKTAYSTDAPSSPPPHRRHHARHSDSSRSTPRYAHTRRKSCHVARPVSCSSTSANASERWVLASRETLWRWRSAARMAASSSRRRDSRMPKGASRGAEVGAGIEGRRSGRGRRGRAVLRFSSASSMRSSVMIPRAFFSGMERSLPEGTLDRRDEAEERRDDLDAAAGRATVETAFVRVVLPSAVRVAVEDLVRDLVSDMPPERVDRRAVPSIAGGRARSPTVNNDPAARALRATKRRRASAPHAWTKLSRGTKRARTSAGHLKSARVDVSTASALGPPPVCDAHRRSRDRFSARGPHTGTSLVKRLDRNRKPAKVGNRRQ